MYRAAIRTLFGNVELWNLDICLVAGAVGEVGVVRFLGAGV